MKEKCENCRFWKPGKRSKNVTGSCHRHAPRAWAGPIGDVKIQAEARWPTTRNVEWCGEWEEKERFQNYFDKEKAFMFALREEFFSD